MVLSLFWKHMNTVFIKLLFNCTVETLNFPDSDFPDKIKANPNSVLKCSFSITNHNSLDIY